MALDQRLWRGQWRAPVAVAACVAAAVGSEAPPQRVRPLLAPHTLPSEVLQEFIPGEYGFASAEDIEANCRGARFLGSGNHAVALEDFRLMAVDFYASGAPLLAQNPLLDGILRHKRKIAATCPHAVLQVLLFRIEALLLSVYIRSEQSRDRHLTAFAEAATLHGAFSALKLWAAQRLRDSVPELGWPLERGWGRVQRYYDMLWEDVHASEDAWAVMEQPGQISDEEYHAAFADVVKVLEPLGIEWWPCRGTLIALLRHGRRSGRLSRGLIDVVERDIDLMLGVPDESAWHEIGKAIEDGLKALGWERCWTKTSADLGSPLRDAARRDLLYCVRMSPYMLVDITSYLVGSPEPYVFVHRVCGNASTAVPAGPGCEVPANVGPLKPGGGVLAKDSIHPLGRCRSAGLSVPCPRRPLDTIQAMIHSGLDASCIALPTPRGRDPDDPWTKRLQAEGLTLEDVRILRERSARLDALGFQSMSPYFSSCYTETGLMRAHV